MKKFLNVLLLILLTIWQLPQLILGFFVWLFGCVNKKRYETDISCKYYYRNQNKNWGVSLSHFIILSPHYHLRNGNKFIIAHEAGHKKQSKIYGPLYLLIIGLPSGSFNLLDQAFHKKWSYEKRMYWYYHLPWERGANKRSGIDVDKNGEWIIVDEEKMYK